MPNHPDRDGRSNTLRSRDSTCRPRRSGNDSRPDVPSTDSYRPGSSESFGSAASTLASDDVGVPGRLTSSQPDTRRRALAAAAAASAKKGEAIALIDVGAIIAIIDCFVVISAENTRQ